MAHHRSSTRQQRSLVVGEAGSVMFALAVAAVVLQSFVVALGSASPTNIIKSDLGSHSGSGSPSSASLSSSGSMQVTSRDDEAEEDADGNVVAVDAPQYYDYYENSKSAAGPEMSPADMAQAYWMANNAWRNLYKHTFGSSVLPDSITVDALYENQHANRLRDGGETPINLPSASGLNYYPSQRATSISNRAQQQVLAPYSSNNFQRGLSHQERARPALGTYTNYQENTLPQPVAVAARLMAKRFASKRQMRYKQCFFNPVTCFGH